MIADIDSALAEALKHLDLALLNGFAKASERLARTVNQLSQARHWLIKADPWHEPPAPGAHTDTGRDT